MSNDFALGNYPIPTEPGCVLTFHQFVIYDSVNWTQNGTLKWDAVNKQFWVEPDVPKPEIEVIEDNTPVNSKRTVLNKRPIQKK